MSVRVLVLVVAFLKLHAVEQSSAQWSGALEEANRLFENGSSAAEQSFLQAEALARHSGDDLAMAQVWRDFAIWHNDQGRYEESNLLLRKALSVYDSVPQKYALERASVLHGLGVIARRTNPREAESLQLSVVAIIEKARGARDSELLPPLIALGHLYAETGRLEEAQRCVQRAIDIGTAVHHLESRNLAVAFVALSEVQLQKGDYSAARASADRALRATQKAASPNHLNSVGALSQLGRVEFEMGRYREAEEHGTRALRILEQARSPDHPDVVALKVQLVGVLGKRGKFAEGERILSQAAQETLGEQGLLHAVVFHQLAVMVAAQNRHREAERLFRRSIALTESLLGTYNTDAAMCAIGLAYSLASLKEHAEAEEFLRKSIATLEAMGSSTHPWFLDVLEFQSKLLRKLKRKDDARAVDSRIQTLVASGIRRPGTDTVDMVQLKGMR